MCWFVLCSNNLHSSECSLRLMVVFKFSLVTILILIPKAPSHSSCRQRWLRPLPIPSQHSKWLGTMTVSDRLLLFSFFPFYFAHALIIPSYQPCTVNLTSVIYQPLYSSPATHSLSLNILRPLKFSVVSKTISRSSAKTGQAKAWLAGLASTPLCDCCFSL